MNAITFSPSEILNSLFILPVNEEKAKEIKEKDGIVKPFQDFYLAVYAQVESENPDLIAKAMIPRTYFEKYVPSHTTEMIFETAKSNTRLNFIPVLIDIFETFTFMETPFPKEIPLLEDSLLGKENAYTLTSKGSYLYGSVFMIFPDILDILCARLESKEIFLACTSIHEIMIHPADMFSADDIKSILQSTIDECVDKNIVLTSSVYKYTFLKGIEIAA